MDKLIIERFDSGYLVSVVIERQSGFTSEKTTALTTGEKIPQMVFDWLGISAPSAQRKLSSSRTRRQRPFKGAGSSSPKSRVGHVYVLRFEDRYKIGRSVDVKSRLTAISSRLPFEFDVVCEIASEDIFAF
ncbi:MAG: GIY-YIG nuclease family protein [Chloroflexota bacterium]